MGNPLVHPSVNMTNPCYTAPWDQSCATFRRMHSGTHGREHTAPLAFAPLVLAFRLRSCLRAPFVRAGR